jgi:OOP family OmpA-OmpF porin
MNKILLHISIAAVMFSLLHAGSKNIAPAQTEVLPIKVAEPSPWYIGAGLVWGRFYNERESCQYEDITYGAIVLAGYEWNPYIGIEARGVRTFWDEGENGGERLQHVGLFIKPMYPLGEKLDIYALLGYGWTKSITGGNGNLPVIDEDGFSWGAGLEFDFANMNETIRFDSKQWGLFVDYQRLLLKSDLPDMDIVSVGITYNF